MLQTPWGDADALMERKLSGGPGRSREALRREQRERLFAATVAACVRRGYAETSVEEILELSGVSRGTFYKHFDDKLACFLALEEELISATIGPVAERLAGPGGPEDRARRGLQVILDQLAAQPDAARACLVESYAAGPAGVAPIAAAMDRVVALTGEAIREISGRREMPTEILQAIVGGWYQVVHRRLREHREIELPRLGEELWGWAMSYRVPPRPLRRTGRRGYVDLGATAPPFAAYSPEQRIIRAFAAAVAEKGYPSTTIGDIAAAASISQTTLYQYFANKADLLEAALESSGAQLIAASLPSAQRAPDPLMAVRVGLEAGCGFLAAEPDFAWLRNIGVYSAGPAALAIRNRSGSQLLDALLEPILADLSELPTVPLEATLGAIFGVLYTEVLAGRTAQLPEAAPLLTYLALAPMIGTGRAAEVATADAAPRGLRAS
jgi:AcrR family transcriptional regulator